METGGAMSEVRLTEEKLRECIKSVKYTRIGVKTTICCITLKNGFELIGTSGCVDPANYVEETGQRIAYEEAFDKIWMLEGYKLQCKCNK